MSGKPLARVDIDYTDTIIVSGATTVFANDANVATQASVTASGNTIATSTNTVYANNKPLARESDVDGAGNVIRTGSDNICVGD